MQEVSEKIISRSQYGSATTFAKLVERYQRPLFAYIYRLGCTAADREPEDIVQEIFLKVYQNIHNFKQLQGACFSAWLFTIARNYCVDLMRKTKTDVHSKESKDKSMIDLADKQLANPQKQALQNEIAERVAIAVGELNKQERFKWNTKSYYARRFRNTSMGCLNTSSGKR